MQACKTQAVQVKEAAVTRYESFMARIASGECILTDGATVFVPTFDPVTEAVAVSGDVDRPGYYDWRPADTAVFGGRVRHTGGRKKSRPRATP